MSFGSLSTAAIEALNAGAKIGEFAHNTGEGGISPYHLKHGGDLIWQIGTGYFGARAADGNFSLETFRKNSHIPEVKMIEIKLSQGAKPGHGGILPAKKNTPEIAAIRHVEPYTTIYSPPYHSAFGNPIEFIKFIQELRAASGNPWVAQINAFESITLPPSAFYFSHLFEQAFVAVIFGSCSGLVRKIGHTSSEFIKCMPTDIKGWVKEDRESARTPEGNKYPSRLVSVGVSKPTFSKFIN